MKERREYILDSIKLNDNKNLTEESREQVVKIFMEKFDAISIDDHDFGTADLLNLHI